MADILSGKAAPAGRLPITQYPKEYTNQVPMTDMTLRPSATNPGRTYKWYSGAAVYEFGHGLHYTDFQITWPMQPTQKYSTDDLKSATSGSKTPDLATFDSYDLAVKNIGNVTSDYVALLFLTSTSGPQPAPKKSLIGYERVKGIEPGQEKTVTFTVGVGSVARADEKGNLVVYSGSYKLLVDTGTGGVSTLGHDFEVEGDDLQISEWPQDK